VLTLVRMRMYCESRVAYIVPSLWLPQANVLGSESNDITLIVHDTGSRAACADINTDIVLDIWTKPFASICGHGHLMRSSRHVVVEQSICSRFEESVGEGVE
jgi:hypothetical protein